jgi:hypothetical protein
LRCDYTSGCAKDWTIVGTGDINTDGKQDVPWHNRFDVAR